MFTRQHLVSFGNYLLSQYDVKVHSTDGKNTPLYQRQVADADTFNWKEEEKIDEQSLPSQHQIEDKVWLKLWSATVPVEILAVHFYPGKVKYDVEVFGDNGEVTRLYNVDSAFLPKTK